VFVGNYLCWVCHKHYVLDGDKYCYIPLSEISFDSLKVAKIQQHLEIVLTVVVYRFNVENCLCIIYERAVHMNVVQLPLYDASGAISVDKLYFLLGASFAAVCM